MSIRNITLSATALLALVLCFLRFGFTWMLPLSVAITAVLLTIAVIDFDTHEIPDKFVIALIPLAILTIWIQPEVGFISRAIGLLVISLPMLVMALVINNAFGGGDIKLMAVCGFLLGWQQTLVGFFAALVLAVVWGIYLRIKGKNKRGEPIAFGPALCTGVFVALLYGNQVITAYLKLFHL